MFTASVVVFIMVGGVISSGHHGVRALPRVLRVALGAGRPGPQQHYSRATTRRLQSLQQLSAEPAVCIISLRTPLAMIILTQKEQTA